MHLGFSPPIAADADLEAIDKLSTLRTMPEEFMKRAKVYIEVAKHADRLTDTCETVSLARVRLLEARLDLLAVDHLTGTLEKKTCEFIVLVARLHAYAQLLTSYKIFPSREGILSAALAAAQRIISIGAARIPGRDFGMGNDRVNPPWVDQPDAIPKNYTRGLAFAAIFILRYTNPEFSTVSEEEGIAAENQVLRLLELFLLISMAGKSEYWKSEYWMLADAIDMIGQSWPGCAEGDVLVTHPALDDRTGTHTRVIKCVGGDEKDVKIGVFLRTFWESPSMEMLHMEHVMGVYSRFEALKRTVVSDASTSMSSNFFT
ncbi:hypothetical protein IMZ48_17655 [Candidatus Bathyarchaeota archaeon]|nr:hypothetical protein [Candidatus Bathyarchaeota archaeon]